MIISQNGLDFIKKFEGYRAKSYFCPAGKLTIGYGHVITPHEKFNTLITVKDAERILIADLKIAENAIAKYVKVPLKQGQYDALVSLVFNWGVNNFLKSRGFTYLNNSEYEKATEEFFSAKHGVVKVNNKLSLGLYNRRQGEFAMWNSK